MFKLNDAQKAWAKDFFETVVTAVILALIIRTFVIQPFKIPTGSMEPTLIPGDRILVLRYAYGLRIPFTYKRIAKFHSPETGDIVVFNYPEEPMRDFIKRCVGKPGDSVELRNGQIYLNTDPSRPTLSTGSIIITGAPTAERGRSCMYRRTTISSSGTTAPHPKIPDTGVMSMTNT